MIVLTYRKYGLTSEGFMKLIEKRFVLLLFSTFKKHQKNISKRYKYLFDLANLLIHKNKIFKSN